MGVCTCVRLHDYASCCPCYRREEAILQIKFPDTMLSHLDNLILRNNLGMEIIRYK